MSQRVVILLGPPGAGKGTQATRLGAALGLAHISTGDLFRENLSKGTALGQKARGYMDAGQLVPDQLVLDMLFDRVSKSDCSRGYLLDGFPRTIPQAEALRDAGVEIDHVLEIAVADEEIISRMSGRRVHPTSGRTYHIQYNPPKVAGKDDETGEELIQREDDQEETVRKRLDVYHAQTLPLVGFYQDLAATAGKPKYSRVEGVGSVEEITDKVLSALS